MQSADQTQTRTGFTDLALVARDKDQERSGFVQGHASITDEALQPRGCGVGLHWSRRKDQVENVLQKDLDCGEICGVERCLPRDTRGRPRFYEEVCFGQT